MIQHQAESHGPISSRRRFEVSPPQRSRVRGLGAPWFDFESRRCVYALVAAVVHADGCSSSAGDAFLYELRAKLGISHPFAARRDELDVPAMLRQLPHPLRYLTLQLGFSAATVDGVIVPAGRYVIDEMAGALGLSRRFVNMRLAQALARPRTRH